MSYILEALRKADLQRQLGKPPQLVMGNYVPIEPKTSPIVLLISASVALLGAGVLAGWLINRDFVLSQSGPATAVNAKVAGATTIRSSARDTAPGQGDIRTEQVAKPPPIQAVASTSDKKSSSGTKFLSATSVISAKDDRKVVALHELPAAIQQELPKLTTSLHAYAIKPMERLVRINNHLLHEGDSFPPGITVDGIESEGTILSYKSYRFFYAVP